MMASRRTRSKRKRKQPESSCSDISDSASDSEPVNKRRKLMKDDESEKMVRKILKTTSVLISNSAENKFIELVINSNGKSYTIIRGKLGNKGRKQIKHFKWKKTAMNAAVKLITV